MTYARVGGGAQARRERIRPGLFDIPVYMSSALTEHEEIAFAAGSHHEVVRMAYAHFERLVKPQLVDFTSEVA